MFERFTESARQVLLLAQEEAGQLNHTYVGTEHLLLGMLSVGDGVAAEALKSFGVSLDGARDRIRAVVGEGGAAGSEQFTVTPRLKKILELSLREALQLGAGFIDTEHLLLATIREGEGVALSVLAGLGVQPMALRQRVLELVAAAASEGSGGQELAGVAAGPGRRSDARTYQLDQVGTNLTRLASEAQLDPVIGREAEIDRVVQVLLRRTKNNPAILGEAGVGKSAIVEGLAQRIVAGDVPTALSGKEL